MSNVRSPLELILMPPIAYVHLTLVHPHFFLWDPDCCCRIAWRQIYPGGPLPSLDHRGGAYIAGIGSPALLL